MSKEELLNKLVDAFYYEMDWESKENIDSAMTLCLPIIEEYAQSKVNNSVLDDVINLFPSYNEALKEAQKTYLSKHVSEGVELYEEKAFMKGCNFIAQKVIGNNL